MAHRPNGAIQGAPRASQGRDERLGDEDAGLRDPLEVKMRLDEQLGGAMVEADSAQAMPQRKSAALELSQRALGAEPSKFVTIGHAKKAQSRGVGPPVEHRFADDLADRGAARGVPPRWRRVGPHRLRGPPQAPLEEQGSGQDVG